MADETKSRLEVQFDDEAGANGLEAQALAARVARDPEARQHYEQLVRIERALEGGAPVTRGQLARMKKRGPPLPASSEAPPARPRWTRRAGWLSAAAALAAAFVFAPRPSEWAARGGASTGDLAWIRTFSAAGREVRPVAETLGAKDGLVFAYHNLERSPYRYLVIVGRDAAGRVHWYHPAYRTKDARPVSLPIRAGVADVELRERIFAAHAPGRLEICGLFTVEPLEVRSWDQRLEQGAPWPKEAYRSCVQVEVQR